MSNLQKSILCLAGSTVTAAAFCVAGFVLIGEAFTPFALACGAASFLAWSALYLCWD